MRELLSFPLFILSAHIGDSVVGWQPFLQHLHVCHVLLEPQPAPFYSWGLWAEVGEPQHPASIRGGVDLKAGMPDPNVPFFPLPLRADNVGPGNSPVRARAWAPLLWPPCWFSWQNAHRPFRASWGLTLLSHPHALSWICGSSDSSLLTVTGEIATHAYWGFTVWYSRGRMMSPPKQSRS